MRLAYFHCASGVSGDMCLGALMDAGAPVNALKRELKKLGLKGYSLSLSETMRAGLKASKATVRINKDNTSAKRLKDVMTIINGSSLSPAIKKKGLAVFQRLFEAEALVHGTTPGRAHLHELGAVDAMVDIMGTIICLDLLEIERVACSEVNLGSGSIETSHGILPVPAPATAELLRGRPVYSDGAGELATPTGAALMAAFAHSFGPMPAMSIEVIGTGAGGMDIPTRPNVLRVFIGEAASMEPEGERVTVMETNIDDMSPEIYGYVMERLFEAGAFDVWTTQAAMKKNRPATVLSAICPEQAAPALMEVILTETTTLGLRYYSAGRVTLGRSTRKVKTPYGEITIKDAYMGERLIKSSPEYEDARLAAKKHKVPLRDVMDAAKAISANAGPKRGKKK